MIDPEPARAGADGPLRRSARVVLPAVVTVANLVAGVLAILLVVAAAARRGDQADVARLLDAAGWVLVAGMLLDVLDGVLARWFRAATVLGTELDALADLVSFGVAPAVIATAFAGGFLLEAGDGPVAVRVLAVAVACGWVVCAAFRLARFTHGGGDVAPSNPWPGGGRWFAGLPTTPAAGMAVVVVGLRDGQPLATTTASLLYLAMLAGLAALMVTRWRYRSQRDLSLIRPRSPGGAAVCLISLAGLVFATVGFLTVLAGGYVLSGLVGRLRPARSTT